MYSSILKGVETYLRGLARTVTLSTSSSAVAERPCDARWAILRGWVNLRLDFRLTSYVLRQYLWTLTARNGYTTSLQLEVFTQRNFLADFIRLKLNLFLKTTTKSCEIWPIFFYFGPIFIFV